MTTVSSIIKTILERNLTAWDMEKSQSILYSDLKTTNIKVEGCDCQNFRHSYSHFIKDIDFYELINIRTLKILSNGSIIWVWDTSLMAQIASRFIDHPLFERNIFSVVGEMTGQKTKVPCCLWRNDIYLPKVLIPYTYIEIVCSPIDPAKPFEYSYSSVGQRGVSDNSYLLREMMSTEKYDILDNGIKVSYGSGSMRFQFVYL